MGNITTNAKIAAYVDRLFKERYVVLDKTNEGGRGAVASMAQRLRELRKLGVLMVAHDDQLKCTVFLLLQDGVKIDKQTKYNFGGSLLHYVLTGTG